MNERVIYQSETLDCRRFPLDLAHHRCQEYNPMTQLTEKKPGTDMSPMKSATDLQAPEESAEETREEFVGRSLSVEFCTQCGYAKRFSDLSTKLAKRFPGLTVLANPQPPRMSRSHVLRPKLPLPLLSL